MDDERILVALRSAGITDPEQVARATEALAAAGVDEGPASSGSTPAEYVSQIEAALAEHEAEPEGGEVTAYIGPHAIRIRPVSTGEFLRFTASLGGGEASAGVGFGRLVRIVVHPEDQEACWDAMDEAGWDVERAMTWVRSQVEVATGRPTSPPSPSRAQRRHPGPSSNGASRVGATRSP